MKLEGLLWVLVVLLLLDFGADAFVAHRINVVEDKVTKLEKELKESDGWRI